jgi:2-aminobenzoate-CoA ligase
MPEPTGHLDTFVRDHLPPEALLPEMDYSSLPALAAYPSRLNAGAELLDKPARGEFAARPAIHFEGEVWTYAELLDKANRIASALTGDLGLVPGGRVLLRSANHPLMVACCLGVWKAGGIVIPTMPVLRERELVYVMKKAQVQFAVSDARLAEDIQRAGEKAPSLQRILYFGDGDGDGLEALMEASPDTFENADTSSADPALIGFTSGSTGTPKGTVHLHKDLLAVADTFAGGLLDIGPGDIVCGSPQIAFLYGLCAFIPDTLRFGASAVLLERGTPEALLKAIERHGATVCFSTPSGYTQMLEKASDHDLNSLRVCVAGGEPLAPGVFQAWKSETGVEIINGLGISELLHIFISAKGGDIRPGAIGKEIPGYRVRVVDGEMNDTAPGEIGQMIVKGPTGCRYLDDLDRQKKYVQDGWNMTGDLCRTDEDGYIYYEARTDDMINTGGYNVSGIDVESVLIEHPKVRECAVVGSPDKRRGQIVKAFVVLAEEAEATGETAAELQDFVKSQIAAYKYPRAVEFVESLPLTPTGKIQRGALRNLEIDRNALP